MLDLLHLYLVTFYKLSFRNATISAKRMTDRLSYRSQCTAHQS